MSYQDIIVEIRLGLGFNIPYHLRALDSRLCTAITSWSSLEA
jgi:hypothetical protein